MCASYGIGGLEPQSSGAQAGRVRFEPISPTEQPGYRETMSAWLGEHGGRARITGRIARNLNPVIHAPCGEREVTLAWWWLHVDGVPAGYSAFNSRDDRLMRSWRVPFQHRALLPADWYVEKGRTFALRDREQFGIAAITTVVPQPGAGALVSYSMVTRGSVAAAASVHARMPLILPREFHDEWLDRERVGDSTLVDSALIASEELSRAVEITGAARAHAAPGAEPQPTLF